MVRVVEPRWAVTLAAVMGMGSAAALADAYPTTW